MAGRRPPSDLGSQWVTVPRQFRGIKSTSLPTELAYVTPEEVGLLRQADIHRSGLANKSQGGPGGVLSLDDSGGMYTVPRTYTPGGNRKGVTPAKRLKPNFGNIPTKDPYETPAPSKPSATRADRGWKPSTPSGGLPAYMADKPGPASVYVGGGKTDRSEDGPPRIKLGIGGGGTTEDKSGFKKSGGLGLGGWAGTGMTREEYVRNIGTGAGDDPPPRNGDDPPPPDFDFTKITSIIGGTEGLYGGDSGSLWNSRGNYHETDPGKGNYTTAAGGRKGLGDPRVDYGGPGYLYWMNNDAAAVGWYKGLTTEQKRRADLEANAEANRPSTAKSFGDFERGGGKGWQAYVDYLNEFEAQEGGGSKKTGPSTGNTDNKGGYNPTNIGGFNFTEGYADMVMPVFEMTDDMSIRAQLPKMINTNTALFKAASTKILQDFQKRGIANSSMASGAALQTIVNLSMDILKEDTQRLFQAGQINHEMARERFLKQMQYATEIILRQLTEGGAMSRALLTEQGAGYRSRLTGLVSMMSGEDADPAKWAEYLRLVGGAK